MILTISIALASYNGAKYLGAQLESLSAQTKPPAEVVITDDQSSDETAQIVAAFAATAPFPVRLLSNHQRLGYRANFMRAASLCQSQLIAFCDQDDVWNEDKLERCAEPFVDREVLLVHHNADVVDDLGNVLGRLVDGDEDRRTAALSGDTWKNSLGFTQVFRRSLLQFWPYWLKSQDHLHQGEKLAHDQWIPMLGGTFGDTIFLANSLARYRQHGGNEFGWAPLRKARRRLHIPFADPQQYGRTTAAAGARAEIFETCSQFLDGAWRERAIRAAQRCRDVERYYRFRRALYESDGLIARARLVRDLVISGGYDSLGKGALLKDTLMGVPFGHRAAR